MFQNQISSQLCGRLNVLGLSAPLRVIAVVGRFDI
jgi:hypothetical protein